MLKTYESQGFQYPKERQAQIQALKKELTQHSTEWRTQLAKANQKTLVITAEELKGTPDTILERMASLKNDDGTYTLRMGVSLDSFNVLTNSPNEALRKKVFMARYNRAKDTNFDVMAKIVQGRVRLAKLLGHDSWAASRLEDKMAKNTDTALGFVTDLAAKLRPKFEAEIEELRKIKATETNNANAKIEPWDVFYFTSQYEKKQFQIDENELRKYFEYNHVFDAMVKHYESIFSINVKKVQAPYTWDEKVELLELRDAEKDQILGFLYLDMFPRPADEKYGHFAMFGFRDGITFGNGISVLRWRLWSATFLKQQKASRRSSVLTT
mgnify:CR=1 FL=1